MDSFFNLYDRGLNMKHNVCVSALKPLSMIALLAQPEGHMASLHLPGGVFYPTLPFCTFTTLHRRATGLISDWWAPPPPFPQWNMPFGTSAKVCWVAHARSPNQKTLTCDRERDAHWTLPRHEHVILKVWCVDENWACIPRLRSTSCVYRVWTFSNNPNMTMNRSVSAYQKSVTAKLAATRKIPLVPPSLFLLHSDVPAALFSHY